MLIIPAIDLKDGKCVRLKRGDLQDSTTFSEHPAEVAEKWHRQGCKRLHLVDLNGAFAGRPINENSIIEICQNHPDLSIQLGGGIRTLETAERYLNMGVDYLIVGTKAVTDPEFVSQLCREFPGQIIVGLDAHDGYIATDGWAKTTQIKASELAKRFEQDGINSVIYTDIARDGMLQGINCEQTATLAKSINVPVIASGGITNLADIHQLLTMAGDGVIGAVVGRAIYEGTLDFVEAQTLAEGIA